MGIVVLVYLKFFGLDTFLFSGSKKVKAAHLDDDGLKSIEVPPA